MTLVQLRLMSLTLIIPLTWVLQAEGTTLSPKVVLRSSVGITQNTGSTGSSAASVFGGFNIQYQHFLRPDVSLGIGYSSISNPTSGTEVSSGFELMGNWYFLGRGTRIHRFDDLSEMSSLDRLSAYVGGMYSSRSYFLGPDPDFDADEYPGFPAPSRTGTYSIANLLVGVNWGLTKELQLNGELSHTLFSFSSSDLRDKFNESLLWVGVAYVF